MGQVSTKLCQILTIYVKNHKMHVENFQGRHFPRKKNLRECQHIAQGLGWGGYWGIGVLGGYWGKN